eukprot:GHVQ01000176.1.p1 GENE.GHVQ01000176.1~~GHVQ01000176.1.p1  ORF type:complete len:1009 (+),score=141.81 GHVQ01000176.1:122-3148(+)
MFGFSILFYLLYRDSGRLSTGVVCSFISLCSVYYCMPLVLRLFNLFWSILHFSLNFFACASVSFQLISFLAFLYWFFLRFHKRLVSVSAHKHLSENDYFLTSDLPNSPRDLQDKLNPQEFSPQHEELVPPEDRLQTQEQRHAIQGPPTDNALLPLPDPSGGAFIPAAADLGRSGEFINLIKSESTELSALLDEKLVPLPDSLPPEQPENALQRLKMERAVLNRDLKTEGTCGGESKSAVGDPGEAKDSHLNQSSAAKVYKRRGLPTSRLFPKHHPLRQPEYIAYLRHLDSLKKELPFSEIRDENFPSGLPPMRTILLPSIPDPKAHRRLQHSETCVDPFKKPRDAKGMNGHWNCSDALDINIPAEHRVPRPGRRMVFPQDIYEQPRLVPGLLNGFVLQKNTTTNHMSLLGPETTMDLHKKKDRRIAVVFTIKEEEMALPVPQKPDMSSDNTKKSGKSEEEQEKGKVGKDKDGGLDMLEVYQEEHEGDAWGEKDAFGYSVLTVTKFGMAETTRIMEQTSNLILSQERVARRHRMILLKRRQLENKLLKEIELAHNKRQAESDTERELARFRNSAHKVTLYYKELEEQRIQAAERQKQEEERTRLEAERLEQQRLEAERKRKEEEKVLRLKEEARIQAERKKKEEEEQNIIKAQRKRQEEEEAATKEAVRIKEEKDNVEKAKQHAQAALKQTSASPSAIAITTNTDATLPPSSSLYVKRALDLIAEVKNYEDNELRMINADVQWKKLRMEIRLYVNAAYNKLSSLSSQVNEVFTNLCKSLQKHKETDPTGKQLNYALYLLAQGLLKQCRTSSTLNICPAAAWPHAWMLSGVMREFPLFRRTLSGCVLKSCSYAVPMYCKKQQGMNNEAFHLLRGQEEGELEEDFQRRMASIARVWLAFLVVNKEWSQLWMWFARFCNMNAGKPRRVAIILLVAGHDMLDHFSGQFHKVLMLLKDSITPKLKILVDRKPEGILSPYSRLDDLMQRYLRERKIEKPEGQKMKAKVADPRPNV